MGVIENTVSRATQPLDDLVLIENVDDILGVDDSLVPITNSNVTDDLLDVIDSIVYEVADTKATIGVSLGLEKAVGYLNDNGLSNKKILEIAALRLSSQALSSWSIRCNSRHQIWVYKSLKKSNLDCPYF